MNLFGTLKAPRELLFGSGQRHSIRGIAAKLGKRALFVTDSRLASDADFLSIVRQVEEEGLACKIDTSTLPDVPVESAIAAADEARSFAPDLVIGVGGGSCLDMGKCVALLLTHGGRPQDYYGEYAVPGPIMPLIAISTTAGTGSEVTPVAAFPMPNAH